VLGGRSAWLRFAERLDELAAFAAGLHPPAGTDAAAVSAAFGRTASGPYGSTSRWCDAGLASHVPQHCVISGLACM
jgi:hypothetical protein